MTAFPAPLLFAALSMVMVSATERPIIGIMTQPAKVSNLPLHDANNHSFVEIIAASYVKWAEGSGAQVVPVRFASSKQELTSLFHSLNGVIFPGGSADLNPRDHGPYYAAGRIIFDLAKKSNDDGDPFPIWGTCLGLQELSVMGAGDNYTVLDASGSFVSEDVNYVVDLKVDVSESRILSSLGEDSLHALTTHPVTYNSHSHGVTPTVYRNDPELPSSFGVVGTSKDDNGKEFIAMIEARDYPFYATQFHPEKALYEWMSTKHFPHGPEGQKLGQQLGSFFISEARKSSRSFKSIDEETAAIIHNLTPQNFPDGYFEQIYIW